MFFNEFTGVGLAGKNDGGKKYWVCAVARKKQGGSSPSLRVKEWCRKFNHALDRRFRTELTTSYITESKLFTFIASQSLSDYGVDLRD